MANNTTLSERITKIRLLLCDGNNQKFADAIGVTKQSASSFCHGKKSIGSTNIDRILEAFPQVRRAWLMCGDGEMLNDNVQQVQQEDQPANLVSEISRLLTLLENKDRQIERLIALLEDNKKTHPEDLRKDECNETRGVGENRCKDTNNF